MSKSAVYNMDKSTSNRNRNRNDINGGLVERSVQTYIYIPCVSRRQKNITIMRKEFENVKNTQVELLEMKTTMLKVKNSLDEVFL